MKGLNDGICTIDDGAAGVDIAQIFEVSMTEWGKKGFEKGIILYPDLEPLKHFWPKCNLVLGFSVILNTKYCSWKWSSDGIEFNIINPITTIIVYPQKEYGNDFNNNDNNLRW